MSAEAFLHPRPGNDTDGNPLQAIRVPNVFKDVNNVSINTAQDVWAPASSLTTVRLMGGSISTDTNGVVVFQDTAASPNVIWRTPFLTANVPYSFDLSNGRLVTSAGTHLQAVLSGAHITGTLYGTEE